MMRRSTQPDQQRAAAEVLRNSGHPPRRGASAEAVAETAMGDVRVPAVATLLAAMVAVIICTALASTAG